MFKVFLDCGSGETFTGRDLQSSSWSSAALASSERFHISNVNQDTFSGVFNSDTGATERGLLSCHSHFCSAAVILPLSSPFTC